MGYTHYWKNPGISTELWSAFRTDVTRVLDQYQLMKPEHPLAGPRGQGLPEVNAEQIAFNSREPDEYEPFTITPAAGTGFCKTQWMPYDVAVCAVLLRASLTIDGFDIDSDGGWDDPDWAGPRALYTSVFEDSPSAEPFRDPFGDKEI